MAGLPDSKVRSQGGIGNVIDILILGHIGCGQHGLHRIQLRHKAQSAHGFARNARMFIGGLLDQQCNRVGQAIAFFGQDARRRSAGIRSLERQCRVSKAGSTAWKEACSHNASHSKRSKLASPSFFFSQGPTAASTSA